MDEWGNAVGLGRRGGEGGFLRERKEGKIKGGGGEGGVRCVRCGIWEEGRERGFDIYLGGLHTV